MRKILAALLLLSISLSVFSQLKSPKDFLGYSIGEKYTPHWKVVSYFQSVAAAAPDRVKLQSYGETNEGRPLMLAIISSPENMQNLENIRKNNLRLANTALDRMASMEENAPAIVWLSYNVHGNETSSSEAAMMTIYALVDPAETRTKEWLKNTVVIIDPCINPDGRDRYVNWFNSVRGDKINVLPEAREHNEPWPGGRTNHYNFDLNRDWAWQTQVESQQRIKIYHQWLPQVHVDYHEQGINEPYYFAPAAQPYHEVITSWQREFQVTLGRNHAKYFDKEGWLFFTKEVFDLFYPSYGDTYPVYNGAIGMTYEQGGGPRGGAGIITSEGDTLTLLDRVKHHFTTSLSTIEVSSQNAGKLVKEFRKFFNEAVSTGTGEYKTYVIKNKEADQQRIASLLRLMDKNGIQYEYATAGKVAVTGFNYTTGKDQAFTPEAGDILLQSQQPHSTLLKVLFEPRSKLVDSATYDITAWAMPYVYGVTAFASKTKIAGGGARPAKINNELAPAYGYVLPWNGVASARTLGQLMQAGVNVRVAERPFEIGGQSFDRGSLIVIRKGNEANWQNIPAWVSRYANENQVKVSTVNTGFVDKGYDFGSDKVRFLHAPKVALLTGEGVSSYDAGEIWHFFERDLGYPVTLINANDFRRINKEDYQVILLPGGNYSFLNDKAAAEDLKNWISKGGRLIALDRTVGQIARMDWGIKNKKADEPKPGAYDAIQVYEDRESSFLSSYIPGSIFKVEVDNTHPLGFGYPTTYYTLKQDDNMYEFIDGGWNVGVIKKEAAVAGFIGNNLKEKLKDGMVFGVQEVGGGNIVYFADNIMFRNFWENGKLLMCNAVFLVGQ
ncbi:MAG: zinc carboxypeptidase [Sphingobacteriales bacterium 12-47-4]|nr:MAG: zinc carboxypeptidase [Sphingobacteriales bacterium 12-47-4]